MRSLAISTAWPSPSCSFWRTYATWARSLIARTCRSISMSPFSSSRCSSSYDRSKWSSIARFWLEVTMMTCSMPAATASSTAYWMIGLSTSGSISFGCALVAGRKRVPQPAAGKTAFRTRIEPQGDGSTGRVSIAVVVARTRQRPGQKGVVRTSVGRERAREATDSLAERERAIEVGEGARAGQADPSSVDGSCGEGRGRESEDDVEFAVEDQGRARICGQAREGALAGDGAHGLGAALGPESAGDDGLGERRWVARAEKPGVDAVESPCGDAVQEAREGQERQRAGTGRLGRRSRQDKPANEGRVTGGEGHRHVATQ